MAQLFGHISAVAGATDEIHTSALNKLGTRALDADFNEYIYLKGVASLVAGDFVVFVNSLTAILATTTGPTRGAVAVAQAAVLAANWGWFLIRGYYATANVATHSGGSGVALALSATSGRATVTPATELMMTGAFSTANAASNVGGVYLSYPVVVGDIST